MWLKKRAEEGCGLHKENDGKRKDVSEQAE